VSTASLTAGRSLSIGVVKLAELKAIEAETREAAG
jgi:hypothetical protein